MIGRRKKKKQRLGTAQSADLAPDPEMGAVRIIRPNADPAAPQTATAGSSSVEVNADATAELLADGAVGRDSVSIGQRAHAVGNDPTGELGSTPAVFDGSWGGGGGFLDGPAVVDDDVASGGDDAAVLDDTMAEPPPRVGDEQDRIVIDGDLLDGDLLGGEDLGGDELGGDEWVTNRFDEVDGADVSPSGRGADPLMRAGGPSGGEYGTGNNSDFDQLDGDDAALVSADGVMVGAEGERLVLPGDQDATQVDTSEGGAARQTVVINDDGTATGSAEAAPSPRRGMHPRFRERRRAVRRSLGRRRMIGLSIGLVVLLLVLVVGTLLGSGLFVVKRSDISVVGWEHADETGVTSVLDSVVGTPVLRVDEEAVELQLEAVAWVDEAKVETALPSSMSVEISERVPLATFQGQDGRYRVIDDDARVLDIVDGFPVEFVWVTANNSPNVEVGEFAPTGYSAAAQLSVRFDAELRPRVRRIAVEPDGSAVVLYLRDGSRVNFGAARDLLIKLVRLDTLMSDFPDMVEANIDVSTEETTRASDALLKIKEAERAAAAEAEREAEASAAEVAAAEAEQTDGGGSAANDEGEG